MIDFDALANLPENGRYRQQRHPVPIVVALIRSGERFLLIQRKSDSYGGQWALVGGKWDFGETLATAVTREVQEETSLETRFVALKGLVSERVHPPTETLSAAHFLLLVCELVVTNGEAKEQNEGAVAWFTLPEIEALHEANGIIPSDYEMLHQFAEQPGDAVHFEADMIAAIGGQAAYASTMVRFERENGR
ncbi:MAG: NUDIX hydrolase [Anaerolineae bacterium]|nr:NUDIX hydrolase [Anaerolineae bacterium]